MIWRRTMLACPSALVASVCLIALGCGGGGDGAGAAANNESSGSENNASGATSPTVTHAVNSGESPFQPSPLKQLPPNPTVVFKTSAGEITVKLNAAKAPITVDNFIENYVERGFYAGTIFHYVQPDLMVVGGGYDSEYQIKDARAAIQSEADNGLLNKKGTIAMARTAEYQHSATSQFFFNLNDNPEFDHQSRDSAQTYGYCVFGVVTGGMDVLERIAASPTREQPELSPALPVEPIVIQSVEILPN